MMSENFHSQSNNQESKITKPEPIKKSLSCNSLTANSSKKYLHVSTKEESDLINTTVTVNNASSSLLCSSTGVVVNKQKRKISNNELKNQIDQQQVNSLMYSFVTFEGKNRNFFTTYLKECL